MPHPPLPDGWHSIVPRIVVDDVPALVDFLRVVFDATGTLETNRPTVVRIGDAVLMISAEGPRPATSAFLYVYVDDADAVHRAAERAGARTIEPPLDTPYGDRRAMIEDRWGNVWQIATPKHAPKHAPQHEMAAAERVSLDPIGVVRSDLRDRKNAPRQGHEGAPDAWIEIDPRFAPALDGVKVGDDLIVLAWFHRARRETLAVHPRGDRDNPMTGVFATRSPDRPNPIGLHRVTVRAIETTRLRVGPIEAIDGTPIVDLKPVLDDVDDA
jgi:tRNA-Thr(GGU) m(6)t(6)A37 methyltransferase TsaA